MRTTKPKLVDAFLAVLVLAGILGVAFGTSRVQTGGVVAVVLALCVAVAIRPWQRPERPRPNAGRRRTESSPLSSRRG